MGKFSAATDPLLNAWKDINAFEIGDKCSSQFGVLNPDGSNVKWNRRPYILKEEWNNAQSGCVLSRL
jgi:hypothetical protein